MDEESNRVHTAPMSLSLISLMQSPRRAALAVVGVLFLWTALLGIAVHLSGAYATASGNMAASAGSVHRGLAPPTSSRHLLQRGESPDDADDEELRWANKLMNDLSSSAADESVAATLSELRSTLDARDERLRASAYAKGEPGASRLAALRTSPSGGAAAGRRRDAAAAVAGRAVPGHGGGGQIDVPRYNPRSVSELQTAALAAAMPEQVKGPLPQLVRDLSSAIARQQAEHEALQRRFTQLQPA